MLSQTQLDPEISGLPSWAERHPGVGFWLYALHAAVMVGGILWLAWRAIVG